MARKSKSRSRSKRAYKAQPMAKRKRSFKRRASAAVRSFSRKGRRSSKRSSSGNLSGVIIGGMIYGAGREWTSNKLAPLTSQIPAGDLADEVGMGLLSYGLAKGMIPLADKVPYSKQVGLAGLTIESARVGAYASNRFLPSMSSTNSVSNGVVYQ